MTGQRSTGTRRPYTFPAWWRTFVELLWVLVCLATLAGLAVGSWAAVTVVSRPLPTTPTVTVTATVTTTPTPSPSATTAKPSATTKATTKPSTKTTP